jgi:hypothetical protein
LCEWFEGQAGRMEYVSAVASFFVTFSLFLFFFPLRDLNMERGRANKWKMEGHMEKC